MQTKAIFTGSFDPLTNGHIDIITRAARIFDELTVGIISNPAKVPLFPIEERQEMITEALQDLPNIKVVHFSGLLADFVNRGGYNVVVRSMRSVADFEYEVPMERMNGKLYNDGVETVFLMADPQYTFLSSSMVKEVHSLGGSIEGLVPEEIRRRMDAARAAKQAADQPLQK